GAFVAGEGRIEDAPVTEAHLDRIVSDTPIARPLKVVWDPGHGAPASVLPALTSRLPGEHVLINCEVDSTFPAHHPDPTQAENLVQLQEEVLRQAADLGIAFDG
ncbi:MAG: phosphomannomutase, partial [Alphaproteobacteria bacterium]